MIAELPQVSEFPRLIGLINERLRDLDRNIQEPKFSGDLDMAGNRIINLGSPQGQQDAARLADLTRRTSTTIVQSDARVWTLVGPHPSRGDTTANKDGTLFWETDRKVLYAAVGGVWFYVSGAMAGTLSPNQKPADLGTQDTGFLFESTDYLHTFRWSGTAWAFAPGDPGSAYIVASGPVAPQGGLWGLCDGTAYNVANSDGTLTSRTSPNLTGDIFLKGASSAGSVQSATTPTLSGSPATASGGAHTHTVNPASFQSSTPTGTQGVTAGATLVGDQNHFHDIDVPSTTSSSDGAHTHTVSAAGLGLQAPSEAVGGLPLRIALAWYIRR